METPHLTTESPEFQAVFPYKPKFFTYGNHKLHYVDEGSGPVLLLLHACPMWSFSFRYVIREFSRNHRVIAVDQMGFGLSDKPERFDYHLENHIENMNYAHINDINYYFPRVTLSGTVSSRRWSVIHSIFNAAFLQGGMASK